MSDINPITNLPNVRRVVTGHKTDGTSTILVDDRAQPYNLVPVAPTFFSNVHRADDVQPSNAVGEGEELYVDKPEKKRELVGEDGSVMWIVDLPPKAEAPLHRTLSLDYGIVMKGSVTLILENNQKTTLNAGDVVVQRGTLHGWKNETDEWTRMYFVMLPSKKVVVGDQQLEAKH